MASFRNASCILLDSFMCISRKPQWNSLLNLSYDGDTEKVMMCLRRRQDINAVDDEGLTALMIASYRGHNELVKQLVECGADVNATTKNMINALMFAACQGHDYIVFWLIRFNANFKLINSQGDNPLMIAAAKGHLKIVELLLSQNIEVNLINKGKRSALMSATLSERENVVDVLLKHKADGNMLNDQHVTCLMIAAEKGNVGIVQSLLDHRVNCNILNKKKCNALMYAAKNGHSQIVSLLLINGIDVDTVNAEGESALTLALKFGHLEIVGLLIQREGVSHQSITIQSTEDLTWIQQKDFGSRIISELLNNATMLNCPSIDYILQNYYMYTDQLKCGEFSELDSVIINITKDGYLKKDAICKMVDKINILPLHLATHLSLTDVVKVLLKHNADVNAQDHNGDTSLMIACSYSNSELAKLLITANTNLHLKNSVGFTVLHIAIQNELTEVVEMLIENKYNLKTESEKGVNALILACLFGNDKLVENLIHKNVDCNHVLTNGVSPLMLASYLGHLKIVQLLLAHEANIDCFHETACATALALASCEGNNEIVKLLCECAMSKTQSDCSKIDTINFQNIYGLTTLIETVCNGKTETVKILLDFSPDCSLSCKIGRTALHRAAEKGFFESAQLLLKHNTPVDKLDDYGFNALMLASANGHIDIVRELINRGAEVNRISIDGLTALILAVSNGHLDVVKMLVQHGADVNLESHPMYNAVSVALVEGLDDIARFLITKNAKGYHALKVAVKLGFKNVVDLLLKHDDTYLNDAVLLAAKYHMLDILQMILKNVVKHVTVETSGHSTKSASQFNLKNTPIYGITATDQPENCENIRIMVLKCYKQKVFTSIEIISSRFNFLFSSKLISIMFYLAECMHIVVLEPIFYLHVLENKSFCFWFFLFYAIENRRSFEIIIRRTIQAYEGK
ncbi:ankyrin-3-like [Physella acuta]|uniref:ankyrin-3-like n=1 Tax=Physella acuta TaxID=109671 RepID=UPI0027DE39F5|nr:ankyrin-3-like [Physella acuta]